MANFEHIEKLKRGSSEWNVWRRRNPKVIPDFSDADFVNVKIIERRYRGHVVEEALRFRDLNLQGANFSGADLRDVDIQGANLQRANFNGAFLQAIDLSRVDLSWANLKDARLSESNLYKARFYKTDLFGVDLTASQALDTCFIDVRITGACIQDWAINSNTIFHNIECDYIYKKSIEFDGQLRFSDRLPKAPNTMFKPGEFEALIRQQQDTIDLIFVDGIDWQAFFQSFEELRAQFHDDEISIQAIERKNEAFILHLETTANSDVRALIEASAREIYETKLALLETQYRSELHAKQSEIDIYKWQSTNFMDIIKLQASRSISVEANAVVENPGIKINQKVGGSGNTVAGVVNGGINQFSGEHQQTLADAAKEIQDLLNQLAQTYPTTTQTEKAIFAAKAVEKLEQDPSLKMRVIGALKSSGMAALQEAIDNPLFNVVSAFLDGFVEP
jgi:uncharacterized protein YjbI with pentapeptide repeats